MTDGGFTMAFIGWAGTAHADAARAYEDAVLPLLAEHGARVDYRGHRAAGQDSNLPVEVHLIWFPDRAAYAAYVTDPRRAALIEQYGDVFTEKVLVELDEVTRA